MNLKRLNDLKLLYVEDDDKLRENYMTTLSLLFNKVYEAKDYYSAIEQYNINNPDIIIVDINLGKLSGIDIIKKIRENDIDTPVVFLTAFDDSMYLLEAVNLQIDAYIVKPLDFEKLQLAMVNCLKKITNKTIVNIDYNIKYNTQSRELYINNKIEPIGRKVNELLYLFIKYKDKTITKEEIEYQIWQNDNITESAIKNLIANLRKYIGKDKIVNVMGIGWKLNIDFNSNR